LQFVDATYGEPACCVPHALRASALNAATSANRAVLIHQR
jgi:hypothetical protein